MTESLPVLVDCIPLAARLTLRACARRYEGANSRLRGAGTEAVATAHLRASVCRDCDVGAERLSELGGTTMKQCTECKKKLERVRPSGKCRSCDPPAGVAPVRAEPASAKVPKATRPKLVAAAAPEPPVIVWLRLQDGFRALKARHEGEVAALDARHRQERADALAEIGAFERDNPTLADDARRQLENLAEKPALGSAP